MAGRGAGGASVGPSTSVYHDRVWGRPMHGERDLFEMLTLESFQSGLSWLTILRKQEDFRRAFDEWDIERIAELRRRAMWPDCSADASIVRNRAKIEATVANARAVVALHAAGETLDEVCSGLCARPRRLFPAQGGDDLASFTS